MNKILLLLLLTLTLVGCNSIVAKLVSAPEVKAVRLVDFSMIDKQVIFDVDLYNPNAFALPMSGFSGEFTLNNLTIGSVEASSDQKLVAYGTQTVTLPISLDTNALIDAAKSVLTKQQALYSFNGGVDTTIGKVPFSKSGELSAQDIISGLLR
jgi:LEA14-like dessication related protein